MGQAWVEGARHIFRVLGEICCALLPGNVSQKLTANLRFKLLLNLVRAPSLDPQEPC